MDSVKTDQSFEENQPAQHTSTMQLTSGGYDKLFANDPPMKRAVTSFVPQTRDRTEDLKLSINATSPLIQKKKSTIDKQRIKKFRIEKAEDPTDCLICGNVLKDPLECISCRRSFCKECLDEWEQAGKKKCPNGCQNFALGKPHPLLVKALTTKEAECENKEGGCNAKLKY